LLAAQQRPRECFPKWVGEPLPLSAERLRAAQADLLENETKSRAAPQHTRQQAPTPACFDSALCPHPMPLAQSSLLWFRFVLPNRAWVLKCIARWHAVCGDPRRPFADTLHDWIGSRSLRSLRLGAQRRPRWLCSARLACLWSLRLPICHLTSGTRFQLRRWWRCWQSAHSDWRWPTGTIYRSGVAGDHSVPAWAGGENCGTSRASRYVPKMTDSHTPDRYLCVTLLDPCGSFATLLT